ncbi:MAG: hypothetical protein KGY66_02335 [Candidatus Thermoplasmatota archaeon]|nr:hypothetical protein [Candidatus Thermoplasmatota archaeon]
MRRNSHILGSIIFAILGYFVWHFLHMSLFLPPNPSFMSTLTSILSMEVSLFFIMIFASLFGGILPDKLDPPFTSRHRFFAHSKILLYVLLIIWIVSLYILLKDSSLLIWSLYFFLLGYISHLVLDSRTPAGLT